jgi:hypothetical protein
MARDTYAEYKDRFIAPVTVAKVGAAWVVVKDKNGKTYNLTQFGVKGIKNLKKGTRAELHVRESKHFTFYHLR